MKQISWRKREEVLLIHQKKWMIKKKLIRRKRMRKIKMKRIKMKLRRRSKKMKVRRKKQKKKMEIKRKGKWIPKNQLLRKFRICRGKKEKCPKFQASLDGGMMTSNSINFISL